MYNKLFKLSLYFENMLLIKKADLTSDMATRIMHSLVPYTVEHPDEARNIQTHLTDKHLLSVAERYVERGLSICYEELAHLNNQTVRNNIFNELGKKNYIRILEIFTNSFSSNEWDPAFGGKKWASFSNGLLELIKSINSFKEAKLNKDYEKMSEDAGMISAKMNILDGMTHNTGSFLSKMLTQENPNFDNDEYLKQMQTITTIMDAKQLSNKEDVVPFIKPYLINNPENYLYREYFNNINRSSKPNPERTKQEIAAIRARKKLIDYVDRYIDTTINNMIKDKKTNNNKELNTYKNFIIYSVVNNSKFSDIKNELKEITSKYWKNSTKPTLENISNYFNGRKEIGDLVAILDGRSYYLIFNNWQCSSIKEIDMFDETPDVDKVYIRDLDQINIDNLIAAAKEMRSLIDQHYQLGLPSI